VSTIETKRQDPADRLDYLFNWHPAAEDLKEGEVPLLEDGDILTSSTWATYTDTWTATTEIVVDEDYNTDTTATGWVSGGVAGKKYFVTNHVVASNGRAKDRSIRIDCRQE